MVIVISFYYYLIVIYYKILNVLFSPLQTFFIIFNLWNLRSHIICKVWHVPLWCVSICERISGYEEEVKFIQGPCGMSWGLNDDVGGTWVLGWGVEMM